MCCSFSTLPPTYFKTTTAHWNPLQHVPKLSRARVTSTARVSRGWPLLCPSFHLIHHNSNTIPLAIFSNYLNTAPSSQFSLCQPLLTPQLPSILARPDHVLFQRPKLPSSPISNLPRQTSLILRWPICRHVRQPSIKCRPKHLSKHAWPHHERCHASPAPPSLFDYGRALWLPEHHLSLQCNSPTHREHIELQFRHSRRVTIRRRRCSSGEHACIAIRAPTELRSARYA